MLDPRSHVDNDKMVPEVIEDDSRRAIKVDSLASRFVAVRSISTWLPADFSVDVLLANTLVLIDFST